MRVRNIHVIHRNSADNSGVKTQTFIDWYDVADWLKQENLKGHQITIIGWHYHELRL